MGIPSVFICRGALLGEIDRELEAGQFARNVSITCRKACEFKLSKLPVRNVRSVCPNPVH